MSRRNAFASPGIRSSAASRIATAMPEGKTHVAWLAIRGCPHADTELNAENHVAWRSGVKSLCVISRRTANGYQANKKRAAS